MPSRYLVHLLFGFVVNGVLILPSFAQSPGEGQRTFISTNTSPSKSSLKPFSRAADTNLAVPSAPTLGRVFFTDLDRRALDEGRSIDTGEPEADSEPALKAKPRNLSLDGYLLKNGKLQAVWVNGTNANTQRDNFSVQKTAPNEITLTDQRQQKKLELKPGQKGNIDKGDVIDLLPPGAFTR